jgi:hypothetical protein
LPNLIKDVKQHQPSLVCPPGSAGEIE